MIVLAGGVSVCGIVDCVPGLSKFSQMVHARSSQPGVLGAGGESRGTVSSEGRCRTAVAVSVLGGSMVL